MRGAGGDARGGAEAGGEDAVADGLQGFEDAGEVVRDGDAADLDFVEAEQAVAAN